MKQDTDLPADVVAALAAGRKIEAIKRLREQRNLGLKEAKALVDQYTSQHPQQVVQRSTGAGKPVIAALTAIAVAVALYLLFGRG